MRTILTGIGIAVAVGTTVALVGVASEFERQALDTFKKRGEDIVIIAADVPNQLSSELDETIAQKIGALPEVALVSPGLIDAIAFHFHYVLVQGWAVNNPAFNDFTMESGRLFTKDDTYPALLGATVAKQLEKKVGDPIRIKGKQFTVVGIYKSFSVYDNDSIIVKIEELQKLMSREGSVTGFSVVLKDAADAQSVSEKINNLHAGIIALPTEEYIAQSSHIRMIRAMAYLTTIIALFIGTINMANTMAMSVVERTREIGILRAIGWKKWRIVKMIVFESLILSIVFGAIGTACAAIAYRFFSKIPQVGGFIEGTIPANILGLGMLLAAIVGLIGGLFPAIRASRLIPTEAIYHE